jgi:hypothetical protein
MQTRSLVLTALGAVFMIGAAAPAFADRDGWHHGGGGWREHEWRGHQGWRPAYYPPAYYAPPPVYYAPRPAYYPPPVYYAPPVVSFGFGVR